MKHPLRTVLFALLFALSVPSLLSGCATAPEINEGFVSWEDNYTRLLRLTFFKGTGRLGIITPAERLSAGYNFEGLSGGYLLSLSSPVGGIVATATVTDNTLALTLDGKTYKDEYARAMFEQAFGVAIPTDKLQRIYLGIPEGDLSYDEAGRITHSVWDGYEISYSGVLEASGFRLPKMINIARDGYHLKLSLSDFEVN